MRHARKICTLLTALFLPLLAISVQAQSQTATTRPAKGKATESVKAAKSSPAREIFSSAFKLFQEGDYGVAKATFERGLAIDPNNGLGRFYLAETLLRMKDYGGAWEQYFKAMTLLPEAAPQRTQVDAALAEIGRNKEAAAQLNAALAQKVLPSGITLFDWLTAARPRATKAEEAQGVLDEVAAHIRRYGPYPDLIALRDRSAGVLLRKLTVANEEQAKAALPQLEALKKVAGNSTPLLMQLGKALHFTGDFDKARQAYSAALQAMKPDAPARKNVVAALGQIEKREKPTAMKWSAEAMAAYAYLQQELPVLLASARSEPLLLEIGSALSASVYMGDSAAALAAFERLRPLHLPGELSNASLGMRSVVWALMAVGEEAQALALVETLSAALPENANKYHESLRQAGYSNIVDYLASKRPEDARQFLARLNSEAMARLQRKIDFFAAGNHLDLEKWFVVCQASPRESGPTNYFCSHTLSDMDDIAFSPERIKRERIAEMARQLRGRTIYSSGIDPNRVSRDLLFKANLCAEGRAVMPPPENGESWGAVWVYGLISCLARAGDLAGAEEAMHSFRTGPGKDDAIFGPASLSTIAASLLQDGDLERGREWAKRVIAEGSRDETAWVRSRLVQALVKANRDAEAWQVAQDAPNREERMALANSLIHANWERNQSK